MCHEKPAGQGLSCCSLRLMASSDLIFLSSSSLFLFSSSSLFLSFSRASSSCRWSSRCLASSFSRSIASCNFINKQYVSKAYLRLRQQYQRYWSRMTACSMLQCPKYILTSKTRHFSSRSIAIWRFVYV